MVLLFPPKAFYRILVNLDSRYGTTAPLPAVPADFFASAVITFPKVDNERLILDPSYNLSPVAPVFEALSDPAKSTRLISLYFLLSGRPVPYSWKICVKEIVNTVWALLLVAFI